jgi:hypothetical protein
MSILLIARKIESKLIKIVPPTHNHNLEYLRKNYNANDKYILINNISSLL